MTRQNVFYGLLGAALASAAVVMVGPFLGDHDSPRPRWPAPWPTCSPLPSGQSCVYVTPWPAPSKPTPTPLGLSLDDYPAPDWWCAETHDRVLCYYRDGKWLPKDGPDDPLTYPRERSTP